MFLVVYCCVMSPVCEEAQRDGQLNYVYFYGRKIGLFMILSFQNNLFANEFVLGLFYDYYDSTRKEKS